MSTGFRNGRPIVKSTIEVQMEDIEQELKELYKDINYLKDSLGKKWTKVNTLKTKLEIEKDRKKREELRKLAKTILTKEEDGDLYYSAEEHLQHILNNNNNSSYGSNFLTFFFLSPSSLHALLINCALLNCLYISLILTHTL